ncbi:hypothetical protein FRC00_010668 [Tulasnella sp. 408]|nr:hypothetical protein FRC00_010668 [Tulasnella sp. 408]
MSPSSTDCHSSSDSTRMSSNSPSLHSSSFDPTHTVPTVPFNVFGNDYHHNNASWIFGHSNNGGISYTGGLFGSPPATQQAVEAVAHHCPTTPPAVLLHNLSLSSSSPSYPPPPGPVTIVPSPTFVAPRPVSSSPPLIGCAWSAHFQHAPALAPAFAPESPPQAHPAIPPRQPMQAKLPPEKGRKSFPCLQHGCGMKFPKRNALVQHMRSHTGERPEVCEFCQRAFSLKCNLRRHYRTCKKKKAHDQLATGAKCSPSSPSPSQDHSPSPGTSSPLTATAVAPSVDSPPADIFAAPPFLWGPGFNLEPSHERSAIDMTCGTLFPTPFGYPTSYPTLVHAQF